ncbi:MAG: HAMP domain-containing histidine kinase, partial [Thermoguttaceae bacterium]|nr:HAMP domain-containing histidine kinase [Thermoguttaceae bacterium]
SLKLGIQMLTRYDVSPEQKLLFYEGMMEEVERLDLLINQVLRAGQLEAGLKIGDEPENVSLREVLESAARSITILHHLPPERIEITCGQDVKITASRILLEMIFRNLIDNGIKYGGDPPRVHIHVRQDGSRRLIVKISDNGPGIPKKMRKKIFQRFVRLGGELERRKKGTGLGLYIVMRCLRLLRGTIRVRPNKTGPGTSFFVFLPIESQENP